MSSPQDRIPEKDPQPTPEGQPIGLPQYLGAALSLMEYPERPYGAEELWHLTKATDDDGKEFDFVTLTMMQPNMVYTNWFTEESLDHHIRQAINALLTLRNRNAVSGKLVTANQDTLRQTVEMAKRAGIVVPGA